MEVRGKGVFRAVLIRGQSFSQIGVWGLEGHQLGMEVRKISFTAKIYRGQIVQRCQIAGFVASNILGFARIR